ncbi:calcium uniporter protein 2, mitochondrial [Euphorbia lathyris]|uniref:calcium uniporter protein 2, mitochondrial n=1 Tax=Euphorbia lathyris TaxID=212925 RepID=UPI003313EA24
MVLKKTLAERLFKISRLSNQSLSSCRISNPAVQTRIPQNTSKTNIAPDPGDNGIFRRLFHKRALFQTPLSRENGSIPIGENIMEKLRSLDISKNRIRLDGLIPPAIKEIEVSPAEREPRSEGLTVADARKLLKVAQLEIVKSRLRELENSWIPYSDFVRICGENCSDQEQGIRMAKALDESGNVIVLGNVVFLKPEQVVKSIGGLIPIAATYPEDPRMKELEELEKQKAVIDKKADSQVRRELWGGLCYLVVQTAGFMRLTFWELSWDVMEPICFYVTSIYCMMGYTFFLRTAKEPSFEGFYESRFLAKQKKLFKVHNFDVERYNQLRKICYPSVSSSSSLEQIAPLPFDPLHTCKKIN